MTDEQPSLQTRAGQEGLKRRGVRARPVPDDLTRPYWQAAKAGELRIMRCSACQAFRHPPTSACPKCSGRGVEWTLLSGMAEVYTYAVDHRLMVPGFDEPYVIALVVPVEADADSVRITTNIRGCTPDEVRIGMAVRAVFEPLDDDITLPQFTPVAGAAAGVADD